MVACGLERPHRLKWGKKPPRPPYELDWVNFHTFCHSYATWMRRCGGIDTKDLIDTGRWKSEQSAARCAHAVTGEAASKAALPPTPTTYRPETASVEKAWNSDAKAEYPCRSAPKSSTPSL
ncbi:MAG: hypothetical protein ABSC37_16285 [Xanthobacteraceae bacterium]